MPKIDILDTGGVFVAVFGIRLDEEDEPRLRAIELDLVLGPALLLTMRHGPLDDVSRRVEAHLRSGALPMERSQTELAHVAVDALVDGHLPVMVSLTEVAEQLEERLDPTAVGWHLSSAPPSRTWAITSETSSRWRTRHGMSSTGHRGLPHASR